MTLNFDVPIQLFAAQLQMDIATVVEKIVFDVHAGVSKRTPVDTGRARASWMVQEGTPNLDVAPESSKPSTGKYADQSSPPASPRAQPPAIQISGEQPVHITNNLPYIVFLEEGSSKQAPAGMVAITLREVEAKIEQFIEGMLNRGTRRPRQ